MLKIHKFWHWVSCSFKLSTNRRGWGFDYGIHEVFTCPHPCWVVLLYVGQRGMRLLNILWSFSESCWPSCESLEKKTILWLHRRRRWRRCARNRTTKSNSYITSHLERENTPKVGTTHAHAQTPGHTVEAKSLHTLIRFTCTLVVFGIIGF